VAPEQSPAQKAAAVVSDLVQAWVDEAQRAYDSLQGASEGFAAEDLVDATKSSMERLRPLVQRGIELNLELLRPWSNAFNQRGSDDA
jgi:hypothetical protein